MKDSSFLLIIFFSSLTLHPPTAQRSNNLLQDGYTKQIPVLSYHNVTDNMGKDISYFITPKHFESHIKTLKDHGYASILPQDLYEYMTHNKPLPANPVIISFDDTRKEHFSVVAPILEKYGYKGAFFIMTVAIGKKNYMSESEICGLAERGHHIGHHTWDHQDLRKLPLSEWEKQIVKPKRQLERIISREVMTLAYPFGLCNDASVQQLKKYGIMMAFQLSGKKDPKEPLHTIRRLLVPGSWSGDKLLKQISGTFK